VPDVRAEPQQRPYRQIPLKTAKVISDICRPADAGDTCRMLANQEKSQGAAGNKQKVRSEQFCIE
jgi:hypothetical protein